MRNTWLSQLGCLLRRGILRLGLDGMVARLTQRADPVGLVARLAPRNVDYQPNEIRPAIRDGIRYELDISDFMEWMVYFGIGMGERAALLSLVKPGMTILDVGANLGEVSVKLARAAGPSGRVISFEPGVTMFRKLRRTLDLNGAGNVKAVNLGLGHAEGKYSLATPCRTNRGGSRIVGGGGESIQITTLDRFLEEERIQGVDLIKIDVEGFEMNVLRGAARTLERFHPVLFVELDDANLREQGASSKELLEYLDKFGYRFRNAQTGEVALPTHDFRQAHFDVICAEINNPESGRELLKSRRSSAPEARR